jgi:hypothetical protein
MYGNLLILYGTKVPDKRNVLGERMLMGVYNKILQDGFSNPKIPYEGRGNFNPKEYLSCEIPETQEKESKVP